MAFLRLSIAVALLGLLLPGCKKDSPLKDVTDTKYRVGQRWSYWARPGEEQSTFTIEKIESHPNLGTILHVGLDNLRLTRNKRTEGLVTHLAFSRDAIDKSATRKLEEDANIPPFRQEYEAWKKQVEEGHGSVLQTSIAEQLNAMEDK
jgi:hypothetical protein